MQCFKKVKYPEKFFFFIKFYQIIQLDELTVLTSIDALSLSLPDMYKKTPPDIMNITEGNIATNLMQ